MRLKILLGISLLCLTPSLNAWNAIGHKLIAQIAYDHMTPEAQEVANTYNSALTPIYPPLDFINASVWLDTIRYKDVKWYDRYHYVNWAFTKDGSVLPEYESINAVTAILHAKKTLASKYANTFDKGIALRVLIHVAGDIHQPLHATTLVSQEYPKGDLGGNRFPIKAKGIAKNLHAYWDKGGGLFMVQKKQRHFIRGKAKQISQKMPCDIDNMDKDPQHWLEESHAIGMEKAYNLKPGSVPDTNYQSETQLLSEQRIALAGCRLAAMLNAQFQLPKGKIKYVR